MKQKIKIIGGVLLSSLLIATLLLVFSDMSATPGRRFLSSMVFQASGSGSDVSGTSLVPGALSEATLSDINKRLQEQKEQYIFA
jgi:hypothetical protein